MAAPTLEARQLTIFAGDYADFHVNRTTWGSAGPGRNTVTFHVTKIP